MLSVQIRDLIPPEHSSQIHKQSIMLILYRRFSQVTTGGELMAIKIDNKIFDCNILQAAS
jgi:hypothetical protein